MLLEWRSRSAYLRAMNLDKKEGRARQGDRCLDFARSSASAPGSLEDDASSLGGRTFLRVWRRSGGGDGEAGRTRAEVRVYSNYYMRALQ